MKTDETLNKLNYIEDWDVYDFYDVLHHMFSFNEDYANRYLNSMGFPNYYDFLVDVDLGYIEKHMELVKHFTHSFFKDGLF